MADRYFVPVPIEGEHVSLVGTEAHHLAHVMRGKPGDEVVLFDGSGAEFVARVERVDRARVELQVLARSEIDRELRATLTLGVALPRHDRGRWLVEKLTELGVSRLVPLECQRSADRATAAALDRLRRGVIEASKQCGRNRLMEIAAPCELGDYLSATPAESLRLFAQPATAPLPSMHESLSPGPRRQILAVIGPEGGFSDAEVELAARGGWRAISLGPRILRVETAAVALATAVMLELERG